MLFVVNKEGAKVGKPYNMIESLTFSEDGKTTAWRAGVLSKGGRERWSIVRKGKASKAQDWVGPPQFIGSSSKLAYRIGRGLRFDAATSTYIKGVFSVVLGKKKVGQAVPGGTTSSVMAVSPKGNGFAFVVLRDFQWVVISHRAPGKRWWGIGQPTFSRDGKHLAYSVFDQAIWRVLIDGEPKMGSYTAIGDLSYGPDGQLAFGAREGMTWSLYLDGQRTKVTGFSRISSPPVFPESGKRVAIIGNRGGTLERPPGAPPIPEGDKRPGKWHAADESKVGLAYDETRHLVVPESGPLVYAARTENEWQIIAGDKEERFVSTHHSRLGRVE